MLKFIALTGFFRRNHVARLAGRSFHSIGRFHGQNSGIEIVRIEFGVEEFMELVAQNPDALVGFVVDFEVVGEVQCHIAHVHDPLSFR